MSVPLRIKVKTIINYTSRKGVFIINKKFTKINKRVIGIFSAAVMSVSMLAVGGMTASAASQYQNSNYAVCNHI